MSGRRSSAVQAGVDLALSGLTIRESARQAKCHHASIARVLKAQGEPPRKAGRPRTTKETS
jgi:hypothetical protein